MIEWPVFIAAIFYFLTIYFIVKRMDDIDSKVDVLWQRQCARMDDIDSKVDVLWQGQRAQRAQQGWLPRE